MSKVLLTGASGFVGSATAEALLKEEHSVKAALRQTSSLSRVPGGCETVRVDFLDPDDLEPHLQGIEVIYHIAGATKAASQEEYDRANAATTRALLDARGRACPGALFVLVSSQSAAGPGGRGATTPYGRSKLLAEEAARHETNWVVVRPPAVMGPGDEAAAPFFRMAARGFLVTPWVNRGGFCLIYVDDLVRLLLMLPERPDARQVILQPSWPRTFTWSEFARLMRQAAGRRVFHLRVPAPLVRTAGFLSEVWGSARGSYPIFDRHKSGELVCCDWKLDTADTERLTGWKPQVEPSEAFSLTMRSMFPQGD